MMGFRPTGNWHPAGTDRSRTWTETDADTDPDGT